MRYRCTTCGEEQGEEAFVPSLLKKGRQICRSCKSEYNRDWYLRNRRKHCDDVQRNNARYREACYQVLLAAKNRPCADCGRSFPPIAMDFDHVRGAKVDVVSRIALRQFSISRLQDEIAKCEVVCAICHRLRTARRLMEAGKKVYCFRDDPPLTS